MPPALTPALQRGVLRSYVRSIMGPEEARTLLNFLFPESRKPDATKSGISPLAARSCLGGTRLRACRVFC